MISRTLSQTGAFGYESKDSGKGARDEGMRVCMGVGVHAMWVKVNARVAHDIPYIAEGLHVWIRESG